MTPEQRKFLEGHASHLEIMARPETVSSPATRRFQGRLGEAIRAALAEVDRLTDELARFRDLYASRSDVAKREAVERAAAADEARNTP